MSAPHIQRCTYTELRGSVHWQCRAQDPHPDRGHDLPPDAEFGRDLDAQRPEWLAATLRDRVALQRNTQRRVEELQAIALDLASGWASGMGVKESTVKWLQTNAPTAAAALGFDR